MPLTDYLILSTYLLGIPAMDVGLSAKVKNTKDLLAVGGQPPPGGPPA